MERIENILQRVEGSQPFKTLLKEHSKKSVTVHLENLVGGALSLYSAALARRAGGVHIFVAEDRDAAAYMLNDFYALLDEDCVHFFPTSYKRSIVYGREDAQGVVQRTNTLNALRHHSKGYLVICTYPEALAERVADERAITESCLKLKVGDAMPLEMAKENIRQILTNAHNAEVVARHEEEIKTKALSMGEAEIYKED